MKNSSFWEYLMKNTPFRLKNVDEHVRNLNQNTKDELLISTLQFIAMEALKAALRFIMLICLAIAVLFTYLFIASDSLISAIVAGISLCILVCFLLAYIYEYRRARPIGKAMSEVFSVLYEMEDSNTIY